MPITQNPDSIVPALLSVLVMPNGEIICLGKTIGWVDTHGKWLQPEVREDQ